MQAEREVRALFDERTITVFQAFNARIAHEALALGRFGGAFRRERMTWLKVSFFWMMHRSAWATAVD